MTEKMSADVDAAVDEAQAALLDIVRERPYFADGSPLSASPQGIHRDTLARYNQKAERAIDALIAAVRAERREPGTYRTADGNIEVIVDLAESTSWLRDAFSDEVEEVERQALAESTKTLARALAAVGLPETASIDDLIRHHRNNEAAANGAWKLVADMQAETLAALREFMALSPSERAREPLPGYDYPPHSPEGIVYRLRAALAATPAEDTK